MCELCYQITPTAAISPIFGVLQGESRTAHFINNFPASDHFEGSDAASGTGTAYTIALGDTFEGEISNGADVDWIRIDLTAGEEVVINVFGTNGSNNGIDDTRLYLYNASGTQVAFNEDAFFNGGNYFSLIEYTVPSTGTYYIGVDNYDSTHTGDYIVRTTTTDFRIEDIVSQITEFGWGEPTALGHDENTGDTVYYHIDYLTAAGQQLAEWALEQWSIVTGFTFVETANVNSADIRFDDNQGGAFGGPSSFFATNGVINYGSVNVNPSWLTQNGTTVDSYSFLTYVHEIGHALGLVHSGNYDGYATWGVSNHFNNDSTIFTIMSYFDMEEAGFAPAAEIITPMIADVAAMWALYGIPASVYGGNTTWFANNTLGGLTGDIMNAVWNGAAISSSIYTGGAVSLTVVDTDGIDTIDLSTVSVAQTIDLREGEISLVGRGTGSAVATNSFVIAEGTVIENVIGGSGNDEIWGNDAANNIQGGGGLDYFYEGLGNDTFDGGSGTDRVIYTIDTGGITVADMGGGTIQVTSSLGTDTYTSVEYYEFTDDLLTYAEILDLAGGPIEGDDGPNTLNGTEGDDEILGYGGADTINGFDGADEIQGGSGADSIDGGAGNDLIDGGDNDDTIDGGLDFDHIYGGGGNDTLSGGIGLDRLWGGTGHDTMSGGLGHDFLYGQAGDDTMMGDAGNDQMWGGLGNDTMFGGLGNDVLLGEIGDDEIYGEAGADRIYGGDGHDLIDGGDNDDTIDGGLDFDHIYGGGGNDTLSGGIGLDRLWGGTGHDTMSGGLGHDFLYGQAGDDTMMGDAGNDQMWGGLGNDTMFGGLGNDILFGETDNDTIFGEVGDDEIYGDGGWDLLSGGAGNDAMSGGQGNDRMWGGTDDDVINGDAGHDSMYGEAGNDVLNGGFGDDLLQGGDDNDLLYGSVDDDTLEGGAGNDVLDGGTENDTLTGGAGDDEFIFTDYKSGDVDVVTDFVSSLHGSSEVDTLTLGGVVGATDQDRFDSLVMTQVSTDTHISWNGTTVILADYNASELAVDDFNFV